MQLELQGVLPQGGGLALFLPPAVCHLPVVELRVRAVPGTARAVTGDNAGKPVFAGCATGEDAVDRDDLEVVRVGTDAKVRGAPRGVSDADAIRDQYVKIRGVELHACRLMPNPRLA